MNAAVSAFDWHLWRGLKAINEERNTQAAEEFESALKICPEDDPLLFLAVGKCLTQLYIEEDLHKDVERTIRRMLKFKPYDSGLHYSLGKVLNAQERFSEAETVLRYALKVCSKEWGYAHLRLARALVGQKKIHEGLEAIHKAVVFT